VGHLDFDISGEYPKKLELSQPKSFNQEADPGQELLIGKGFSESRRYSQSRRGSLFTKENRNSQNGSEAHSQMIKEINLQ